MEKMRFGRKFSSFCAFSLIYYSASFNRKRKKKKKGGHGWAKNASGMIIFSLFSTEKQMTRWMAAIMEFIDPLCPALSRPKIFPPHKGGGGGHTKKRTVKRKKRKQYNNNNNNVKWLLRTHSLYSLLVCVGGWCGTYIYNGGLAWLVPSMNIRRSRIHKNNKRFHFVNESDSSLCVPLLSLFPSFCFFFSTRYRKNWTTLNKIKKKRLGKSRQRAKSCVGALARMRRKMIIPFRVYKTKRRRENRRRRCR